MLPAIGSQEKRPPWIASFNQNVAAPSNFFEGGGTGTSRFVACDFELIPSLESQDEDINDPPWLSSELTVRK
jgi:hypothetical protein